MDLCPNNLLYHSSTDGLYDFLKGFTDNLQRKGDRYILYGTSRCNNGPEPQHLKMVK